MAEKRGRLTRLRLLPEAAWPYSDAAIDALTENRRTAADILAELNGHLARLGVAPVSKSGFNRESLKIAKAGGRLRQSREFAAAWAESTAKMPKGDIGLFVQEVMKTLIYDLVMEHGFGPGGNALSPGVMKELSLTLMRLEKARQLSHQTHMEIRENLRKDANAEIDKAVERGALNAEAAAEARRIMGFSE